MTRKEQALALHAKGYNCAQSVFMTMSKYTGVPESQAADLATGFGGGAGCREICGALSGAIMAAGAALGAEQRPQVMALTRELTEEFRTRFGSLRCGELKANRVPCDDLIAFCAEKMDGLLRKEG